MSAKGPPALPRFECLRWGRTWLIGGGMVKVEEAGFEARVLWGLGSEEGRGTGNFTLDGSVEIVSISGSGNEKEQIIVLCRLALASLVSSKPSKEGGVSKTEMSNTYWFFFSQCPVDRHSAICCFSLPLSLGYGVNDIQVERAGRM
eukprot:scaffold70355_cov65-Attheya_sp.AAC.4